MYVCMHACVYVVNVYTPRIVMVRFLTKYIKEAEEELVKVEKGYGNIRSESQFDLTGDNSQWLR